MGISDWSSDVCSSDLRLRGPYFALAILAYAHIFKIVATEWSSVTGGSGGLSSIPNFPQIFGFDLAGKIGSYLIILTVLVIFVQIGRAHVCTPVTNAPHV